MPVRLSRHTLAAGVGLALLLLPASAVLPMAEWNLHIWQRLRTANRLSPDMGTDMAYRDLAPHLPARGVIGVHEVGESTERRLFFRLQYALAPRKIVVTREAEFVIEGGPASAPASLTHDPQFTLIAAPEADLRVYRRLTR